MGGMLPRDDRVPDTIAFAPVWCRHVHYRGKYRHYLGNRRYSAYCHYRLFPSVPSNCTSITAGNGRYRETNHCTIMFITGRGHKKNLACFADVTARGISWETPSSPPLLLIFPVFLASKPLGLNSTHVFWGKILRISVGSCLP